MFLETSRIIPLFLQEFLGKITETDFKGEVNVPDAEEIQRMAMENIRTKSSNT